MATGDDGDSAIVAVGTSSANGCCEDGKPGDIVADSTEKLCRRCDGWGHTFDVCPTANEATVLAVTRSVGARNYEGDDLTAQFSASKTEERGACCDTVRMIGGEELAWQGRDEGVDSRQWGVRSPCALGKYQHELQRM